MSNVAQVLREEIARVARRVAKSAVAPVRKPAAKLRFAVADLRRRVAALDQQQRQINARLKLLENVQQAAPAPAAEPRARITARGVRSLRRKFKMSRVKFAALLGVSPQIVQVWERKSGALRVRPKTATAILAIRNLGSREARARLAALQPRRRQPKPAARRRRRRG